MKQTPKAIAVYEESNKDDNEELTPGLTPQHRRRNKLSIYARVNLSLLGTPDLAEAVKATKAKAAAAAGSDTEEEKENKLMINVPPTPAHDLIRVNSVDSQAAQTPSARVPSTLRATSIDVEEKNDEVTLHAAPVLDRPNSLYNRRNLGIADFTRLNEGTTVNALTESCKLGRRRNGAFSNLASLDTTRLETEAVMSPTPRVKRSGK